MVTVAACQLALADLDPDANLARVADRLAALPDETELAVFPEHTLTGFVGDDRIRDAALRRDGDHVTRVAALAEQHELDLLVGFVERADRRSAERASDERTRSVRGIRERERIETGVEEERPASPTEIPASDRETQLYNTVAYLGADGSRAFYRKRHLWGGEEDVLSPGDERVVVESPLGRAGLVTCYDLNFVAESAAFTQERVDALLVAGAWPGSYAQNWKLLVRARALDGVRWVVGAGRTGRREIPGARVTEYAGQSRVIRPDGAVHSALNRGERNLVADLDPGLLEEQREFIPVL